MTYSTLKEKISAEKKEREALHARFSELWAQAWEAGTQAGRDIVPRVMRVEDGHGNTVEVVPEGPCGFAWLNVPGNSKFGRWLKKNNLARPDYPTGLCVWISAYDQSHDRKQAHAYAMAQVLRAAGIECVSRSRLD